MFHWHGQPDGEDWTPRTLNCSGHISFSASVLRKQCGVLEALCTSHLLAEKSVISTLHVMFPWLQTTIFIPRVWSSSSQILRDSSNDGMGWDGLRPVCLLLDSKEFFFGSWPEVWIRGQSGSLSIYRLSDQKFTSNTGAMPNFHQ